MWVFRLKGARRDDPAVDAWFAARPVELAGLVRPWFHRMRACGDDVAVLLHDGQPTATVGGVAMGYVNTFTSHANVGFFSGAALTDHAGLLEGSGKSMRHVKLRPGQPIDGAALGTLIDEAYAVVRRV